MDLGLAGKVALVTGGARGIGRAIAETLVAEGAVVALNDRDADGAERSAKELSGAGGRALAVPADVTDPAAVAAMVAEAEEALGPIDVLVNNAGVWVTKPFVETTPADWARDVGVNLYGVIHCTHAVVGGMAERGGGAVVSVTSEAGRVGEARLVTYSAAKAGVVGFTKALAKEVGPAGVRVNCVALATTRTPLAEETFSEEAWGKMAKLYPLRRTGRPDDAARAVAFLASDAAAWVTGQTYGVNGGYAMV